MGKKKCKQCKHLAEYASVKDPNQKLYICLVDGWKVEEDGSYWLIDTIPSVKCYAFEPGPKEE